MRPIDGLRSAAVVIAGLAATLKHLRAFIVNEKCPIANYFDGKAWVVDSVKSVYVYEVHSSPEQ